ncbi:hypothetical protein E6O75_ATG09417 [Venturia nashicola]|uniref:Fungal N-terminal domain-containing protein n=1 Tax=Venturia nashicola TaxID=86259 RepID=A0A4Z1P3E3_9PEZI|nr:hypothetical protein E6O75_ATG09417 [Venturia nashicola]
MSDPFSIIAGIAGVSAVGVQLSISLYEISNKLITAPKEIADIASELASLASVFDQLKTTLDANRKLVKDQLIVTASETLTRFDALQKDITEIIASVGKCDRPWERLKWLFKESRIASLMAKVNAVKASLHLLVSIIQIAVTVSVGARKLGRRRPKSQIELECHNRHLAESRAEAVRYTIRELRVLSVREQEASETQEILRFRHWKEPASQTMSWLYYRTLSSAVQSSHSISLGRKPGFAKTVATQNSNETASESEPDHDDTPQKWKRNELPISISPDEEDALWGESKLKSRAVDELLGDWTTMDKNQIHENAMSATPSKLPSFQGSFDRSVKATLKQMKTHMDIALLNGCLIQASGDVTNDAGDIVGKLVKGDAHRLGKIKATCDDEGNVWSGKKRVGKAIIVSQAVKEGMATNFKRPPAPDASEAVSPPPYVNSVSEDKGNRNAAYDHDVQEPEGGEIRKNDIIEQSTSCANSESQDAAKVPDQEWASPKGHKRGKKAETESRKIEVIDSTAKKSLDLLTVLDNLCIEGDGTTQDLQGTVAGRVIEGDANNFTSMMYSCNTQGNVLNYAETSVGKVELVDSTTQAASIGNISKPVVSYTLQASEKAERKRDTDGHGNSSTTPPKESSGYFSNLQGLKIDRFGDVRDADGVVIARLVDGDPMMLCRSGAICDAEGKIWIGDVQFNDAKIEMAKNRKPAVLIIQNSKTVSALSGEDGVKITRRQQTGYAAGEDIEQNGKIDDEMDTADKNAKTEPAGRRTLPFSAASVATGDRIEDNIVTKDKDRETNKAKNVTVEDILKPSTHHDDMWYGRGTKKKKKNAKDLPTTKEPLLPRYMNNTTAITDEKGEISGNKKSVSFGKSNPAPKEHTRTRKSVAYAPSSLSMRSASTYSGYNQVFHGSDSGHSSREQDHDRSDSEKEDQDEYESAPYDLYHLYDSPLQAPRSHTFDPYFAVMPYQSSGVHPPMSNYYGHPYPSRPTMLTPAVARIPEPKDDRVAPLQAELLRLQQEIERKEILSATNKLEADFESRIKVMEEEAIAKRRAETLGMLQGHILEQNLKTLQMEKKLLAAQEALDTCACSMAEFARKSQAEKEQQQQALVIAREEAKTSRSLAMEAEKTAVSKHEESMKLIQQEAERAVKLLVEHQEDLAKYQERIDTEVHARKIAEDVWKEMENQMQELRVAQREETPDWTKTYYAPTLSMHPTQAYREEDQSSSASNEDSISAITETATQTAETNPPTRSGIVGVNQEDLDSDPSQMIIFPSRMGWKEHEYKILTKSMLRFGFRPLVEEGAETPCVPSQFYERPGSGGCTLRRTALWHPPGPSLASDVYTSFLKGGWKPSYVRSNKHGETWFLGRQPVHVVLFSIKYIPQAIIDDPSQLDHQYTEEGRLYISKEFVEKDVLDEIGYQHTILPDWHVSLDPKLTHADIETIVARSFLMRETRLRKRYRDSTPPGHLSTGRIEDLGSSFGSDLRSYYHGDLMFRASRWEDKNWQSIVFQVVVTIFTFQGSADEANFRIYGLPSSRTPSDAAC